MTWRVAYSLDVLLDEINAAAPIRSKVSDGSIGDAAHASRDSDHNPWRPDPRRLVDGVVGARDFTHDPAHGCDAGEIAEAIRLLGLRGGHPALGPGAYVIWNRRIASASYGWQWRPYYGSNPHDHHCHVSVAAAAAGFDSTTPWGVMHEEDIMASKQDLAEVLGNQLDPINRKLDRLTTVSKNARAGIAKLNGKANRLLKKATVTKADVQGLVDDLAEVTAAIEALDEEPKGRG